MDEIPSMLGGFGVIAVVLVAVALYDATTMNTATRTDLLGDITLIVKAVEAYKALDDEGRSAFAEFSLEVLEGEAAAVRKRGAKSIAEMLFPDK